VRVADQLSEVIEVHPGSADFGAVLALWRANRKTLGFLPDEGFLQRAEKGTLLGARAGGELVGYVLFDLPDNKVKLVHLCVRGNRRGTGAARTLVTEVSQRYQQRRGIELACRRDYEHANHVWRKLGFLPLHEKPGRSRARIPLTLWVLDHGHPDLFSEVRPDQELAVLDHTIVVDKAKAFAGEGKHSRPLFEDAWVAELLEVAVTGEAFVEINRQEDPRVREATRAEVQSLRLVRPPKPTWEPLLHGVREAAPKAGESDHNHLAQAAAAGADYFVTRDDDILKGAQALARDVDLQVLRPEALIKQLDRRRFSERYEPRAIEATRIRSSDATDLPEDRLVRAFLNFGRGERKSTFLETLRSLQADPAEHEASLVLDDEGRPLGLVGRHADRGRLEVALIRVAHGGQLQDALARQLVHLQRQAAADRGIAKILVNDPYPSPPVTLALTAEGFLAANGGWSCRVDRGLHDVADVGGLDRDHPQLAAEAAAAERKRWPLKITGAGIPTYLVPIKLTWAERLFDTGLAEQTLLPRSSSLGLSREHVYYRSPHNHRQIGPGARILWYVTGAGPTQHEAHIRAVSQVMEVVTGRPRTLHRRFNRLGVYTEADVQKVASRQGEVMAIRFVDTELLERPISRSQLNQMWQELGEEFHPPQCPVPIGERMFRPIYRRASRYATD
jgi:ribosomal protein S18 acetylase RimI-like enzyme